MKNKSDIKKRIKKLKSEIKYEERKLEICGYGKSELYYIDGLKRELAELCEQLDE